MKQITFFRLLLVASLAAPLFAGCKKKEEESKGSGSAPAAPAGSAAAPAPAPAPTGPKLTVKRLGKDEGTFDKAIFYKDAIGQVFVHVAQNCPKFDCSYIDKKTSLMGSLPDEALQKDCPKAKVLMIILPEKQDVKPGPVKVDTYFNDLTNPSSLTDGATDGGNITEVTDKEVKGTLDLKSGVGKTLADAAASGSFTATVCP
jgi:hypothetical protein